MGHDDNSVANDAAWVRPPAEIFPRPGKFFPTGASASLENLYRKARQCCATPAEQRLVNSMAGGLIPGEFRLDAEALARRLKGAGIPVVLVDRQFVPDQPPYGDIGEIPAFALWGNAANIFSELEQELIGRQLYYHKFHARFQVEASEFRSYEDLNEIEYAFRAAQHALWVIGGQLKGGGSASASAVSQYRRSLAGISQVIREFSSKILEYVPGTAPDRAKLERELSGGATNVLDRNFAERFENGIVVESESQREDVECPVIASMQKR